MTPPILEKRKVYDPILRLIHGWNALSVLGLIATALLAGAFEHGTLEERLWQLHILAGYGLVVGLSARLAWGLVGPRSARLADMWHPSVWLQTLRRRRIPASTRYGHNELASAAYLALYAALACMALTGLALAAIEYGAGPLSAWLFDSVRLKEIFKEPHEAIAWAVGGFIVLHAAGLLYHERIERMPTAQSMLTGNQYRPARKETASHA